MTVRASALAAQALREWLLLKLPAQVATVNATRTATLTTPQAGPFTVPSGASLSISLDGSDYIEVALTSGSRTASDVAAEVEATVGLAGVATALADGRLRLSATSAPSAPSTSSSVFVAADATGTNLALGFDPAGDRCVRGPLVAPTLKGVMDGEPVGMLSEPFSVGRMLVVLRDREDVAVAQELRRDERLATLEVLVYVPQLRQQYSTREEIQAAVECVVDCISLTSGRYLGRAADGDVCFAQVKSVKVAGTPFSSAGLKSLNLMMDIARLTITCRVFQRPALT